MTSVNINDVLDGHVALSVDCIDRLYLNAYVPKLQVGGQVVTFLTEHLGFPIPSPALLEKIGNRFRREVKAFAAEHEVPILFYLHDPTDLPGSAVVRDRLRALAQTYPAVHVFRLGSEAYGLRGASAEEVFRDYRARFTLPHDPHANALQHDLIGQTVHSFLAESGLLAAARLRRQVLHAER